LVGIDTSYVSDSDRVNVLMWLQTGWWDIAAVWLVYWLSIYTCQTSSTLLWSTASMSTISQPNHLQGTVHSSIFSGAVNGERRLLKKIFSGTPFPEW